MHWSLYQDAEPCLDGRAVTITCDGDDVTIHCLVADDARGFVLLLKRNEAGQHYIDPETYEPATELRIGRVTIAPSEPM